MSPGFANAQLQKPADTLTASVIKGNTISGDTIFFQHAITIIRFINRNVRIPYDAGGFHYGSCTLYFIIDTAGNMRKCWCEQVTNEMVCKEMIRVINKLTGLSPTYINNKPVITKVVATVAFFNSEKVTESETQAVDIWVIGYEPVH